MKNIILSHQGYFYIGLTKSKRGFIRQNGFELLWCGNIYHFNKEEKVDILSGQITTLVDIVYL